MNSAAGNTQSSIHADCEQLGTCFHFVDFTSMPNLDQHDVGQAIQILIFSILPICLMCMWGRSSLVLLRIDHWRRSGYTHSWDTHQGSDRRRGCREGWISTGLRLTSRLAASTTQPETRCTILPNEYASINVTSFPGHPQSLSQTHGENSGSGLWMRLH